MPCLALVLIVCLPMLPPPAPTPSPRDLTRPGSVQWRTSRAAGAEQGRGLIPLF